MGIYGLQPGATLRILQTFRDHDGREHPAGQVLRLARHDVFPYDDGHTFEFTDGTVVRLAGNVPEEDAVLADVDGRYWAPA